MSFNKTLAIKKSHSKKRKFKSEKERFKYTKVLYFSKLKD